MTKCFIFDMDGVLTETNVQHFEAWKMIAEELGISIDWDFNEQLKGVSRIDSLRLILKHGNRLDQFTEEEIALLADRKNEIYKQLILVFNESNLFDKVHDLFEFLKGRGIKIAIGSASHNAPFLIQAMGLGGLTDYIVNPGDVTLGKPAPDIFLNAMAHFGLNASECIGIEDASAGISAIKAAGMYAVGIGNPVVLSEADMIYPSTSIFAEAMMGQGLSPNLTLIS